MMGTDEVVALNEKGGFVQDRQTCRFGTTKYRRDIGNLHKAKVKGHMPKAVVNSLKPDSIP